MSFVQIVRVVRIVRIVLVLVCVPQAADANPKAVMLCEQDNDPVGADAARQWIDTAYAQR